MCEPDTNNQTRPARTHTRDFNDCFAVAHSYQNGLHPEFLTEESSKLQFIIFVHALFVNGTKIALVKPADAPHTWTLPRIKVEEVSGDLSAFAAKLVAEICGCSNKNEPEVLSVKMRDNNKLDAYYLTVAPEGEAVLLRSSEKQMVQFFDLSMLPTNIRARDLAQIKSFFPR